MTTLRSIVVLLLLVLAFLQCTLAVPVSHRDAQPPVKKGHDIHSTSTKRPYKQHSSTSLTLPLPAKLKKAKTKTSLDKGKVHTKVSVSGKGDDESSKYLSNGNKGTDGNNNRHHLSHYGDSKARKGKKTSHVGKKNKKHRKGKHHHRDVDAFSTPDNSEPPALSTGGHEQSSTVRRSFLNLDLGPARGDTYVGPAQLLTNPEQIVEAKADDLFPAMEAILNVRVARPTTVPSIDQISQSLAAIQLRQGATDDDDHGDSDGVENVEVHGHIRRLLLDQLDEHRLDADYPLATVEQQVKQPVVVQQAQPALAIAVPQPAQSIGNSSFVNKQDNLPLLDVNLKRAVTQGAFNSNPSFVAAEPVSSPAGTFRHATVKTIESVHGPFILDPSLIGLRANAVPTQEESVKGQHLKRQGYDHRRTKDHGTLPNSSSSKLRDLMGSLDKRQVAEHHHHKSDRYTLFDPLTKSAPLHRLVPATEPTKLSTVQARDSPVKNLTAAVETCPDMSAAVQGFLQLVSPSDDPNEPEPLANLILTAGATISSSFIMNASNDSHAIVNLVSTDSPSEDGTLTVMFVVQVVDDASLGCLCGSYNSKDASPLTLLPCGTHGFSESISQTFLYDPSTSFVQPMATSDSDSTVESIDSTKNITKREDTFFAQDGPVENVALPAPSMSAASMASVLARPASATTTADAAATHGAIETSHPAGSASLLSVLLAFIPQEDTVKPAFVGPRQVGHGGATSGTTISTMPSVQSSSTAIMPTSSAASEARVGSSGAGGHGDDGSADGQPSSAGSVFPTEPKRMPSATVQAATAEATAPFKLTADPPTPYTFRFVRV